MRSLGECSRHPLIVSRLVLSSVLVIYIEFANVINRQPGPVRMAVIDEICGPSTFEVPVFTIECTI